MDHREAGEGEQQRSADSAGRREHHQQRKDAEGGAPQEHHHHHRDHPRSKARAANGWIAAFMVLLFTVHTLLGAALVAMPGMPSKLAVIVWAGAAAAIAHTALSARTTYTMWTDEERPASATKKAHQQLKWASGALLLAAVLLHQLMLAAGSATSAFPPALIAMGLAAIALSFHVSIGIKSLTRDMNAPSSLRTPVKVGTWVCSAAACLILLASQLL